jgi:hypothetical protein
MEVEIELKLKVVLYSDTSLGYDAAVSTAKEYTLDLLAKLKDDTSNGIMKSFAITSTRLRDERGIWFESNKG